MARVLPEREGKCRHSGDSSLQCPIKIPCRTCACRVLNDSSGRTAVVRSNIGDGRFMAGYRLVALQRVTLKLELANSRWDRTAGLTMRRMTKNIRRRLRLNLRCFRSVELAAAIDMDRLARHVGIRHDHHDRRGDFLARAEALQWKRCGDCLPLRRHHLGIDQ